MQNNKTKNTLIIGLNPKHTQTYIHHFKKHNNPNNLNLKAIVELSTRKHEAHSLSKKMGRNIHTYFIDNTNILPDIFFNKLPRRIERDLNEVVIKCCIDNVIISNTLPLSNQFAVWALRQGLNVLLENPIGHKSFSDITTNGARILITDYENLASEYYKAKREYSKEIIFSVMDIHRHHPAVLAIKSLISEVYEVTGCPITSIKILTHETTQNLDIEYASIDILLWLLNSIELNEKALNQVDVSACQIHPSDFVTQLPIESYRRIFKDTKHTNNALHKVMRNFDTVTTHANLNFKYKESTVCVGAITHTCITQPSQYSRNQPDMNIFIEQGSFQSITLLKKLDKISLYIHKDPNYFKNQPYHRKLIFTDKPRMEFLRTLENFSYETNRTSAKNNSNYISHKKSVLLASEIHQSISNKKLSEGPLVSLTLVE